MQFQTNRQEFKLKKSNTIPFVHRSYHNRNLKELNQRCPEERMDQFQSLASWLQYAIVFVVFVHFDARFISFVFSQNLSYMFQLIIAQQRIVSCDRNYLM